MAIKPNQDPEISSLESEIKSRIDAAPIISAQNGFADTDIYLASSWLIAIHSHVRRRQGDTTHDQRVGRDQVQLLVATANRLGIDVEQLLAVEPAEELAMVLEGLRALEDAD